MKAATEVERRVLIDEFIEEILVLSDYLDVTVHGAPPLHVRYQEVGMKESGFDRVGGPIRRFCYQSMEDRVAGRARRSGLGRHMWGGRIRERLAERLGSPEVLPRYGTMGAVLCSDRSLLPGLTDGSRGRSSWRHLRTVRS